MTGRIYYTPEALQQLHDLDEWITEKVSADAARRLVLGIMAHCDGILVFPCAGRGRDDVRARMRTTVYRGHSVWRLTSRRPGVPGRELSSRVPGA